MVSLFAEKWTGIFYLEVFYQITIWAIGTQKKNKAKVETSARFKIQYPMKNHIYLSNIDAKLSHKVNAGFLAELNAEVGEFFNHFWNKTGILSATSKLFSVKPSKFFQHPY